MKVRMTKTINWLNAQYLLAGNEYVLDHQVSARLVNEGKAVPVGPVPSIATGLIKPPPSPKKKRKR